MKSTQLLSIVLSMILVFGVSAGSAYAETDDVDDARDYDDYDLGDMVNEFCEMSTEDQRQFYVEHPRLEQFSDRIANYCDLSDDERDDALDDFVKEHHDKYRANHDGDMRDKLERYCEMSDTDKEAFIEEHDKAEDHVEKMNKYCLLDEDSRMDFVEEHRDEYKANMKEKMHDKMKDKKHMDYKKLCEMSTSERADKIDDSEKLDRISDWCEMTPEEREDYKMKHHDGTDKSRMDDKKGHMDYDRLCDLTDSERADKIDDSEKLDRISNWCEMTTEEREDYKKEHHGIMKDKKHDFDGMSDVAKDKHYENKMKMSDKSDRLKTMIMNKHDISDERRDEIKAKYIEKHGDLTDAKKSDLKMKFKNHMKYVKHNMSDERKSEIHDRVAEMKAFKAELRENSSDLTDEQKQELREEFIEKAKDMQLAWITPRTQMTAGVDAAEVQCREGFDLVMKASNGVAMCLKADTALKMIDRGIVVPAN